MAADEELTNFIPLIWEDEQNPAESSPGYNARFDGLYGGGGLPTVMFGGDDRFGYTEGYYEHQANLALRYSSLRIDAYLEDIGNNQVSLKTRIEVIDTVVTEGNKLLLLLTDYTLIPQDEYMLPNAFVFGNSGEIDFNLKEQGEVMEYEHIFDRWSSIDYENVRGVVIVQPYTEEHQAVVQAVQVKPEVGCTPDFTADIVSGPASLSVRFENSTNVLLGADGVMWDFDNDGQWDSEELHGEYTYSEPGEYSVKLSVTYQGQGYEIVKGNYITVTGNDNISGPVAGAWSEEGNPYIVSGDVIVPAGCELKLNQGVELVFNNNAKLQVNGKLNVAGQYDSPVIFGPGDEWSGIEIAGSISKNVIRYAVIKNAQNSAIHIDNSSVLIEGSQIYGNSSQDRAPAMSVMNSPNIIILKNFFSSNTNTNYSGALSFSNSKAILKNNAVICNTGGVCSAIAIKEDSEVVIENNTIDFNTGSSAILIEGADAEIINSVVRNNGNLFILISSMPSVSYSCLSQNFNGEGNITDDPQYIIEPQGNGADYDGFEANMYLEQASPLVDAGNPDEAYNDTEDTQNSGQPLYPAQGTLRNDIGATGGIVFMNPYNDINIERNIQNKAIKVSNYPNPFNPVTTLTFQLQTPAYVELDIFNLKGQLIKNLESGNLNHGMHSYIWDGKNSAGEHAASGIYFYRLCTEGNSSVGKLLMIK